MKRYTFLVLTALLLYGCKGDDNPPLPPVAAQLVFPEQNSECTSGTSVSPTQSRVTFSWTQADHTDSYRLTVISLITGLSDNYTTDATSFDVTLQKGDPYSWSVTSLSDSSAKTAKSDVWNFYNAGDGVASYAPFPANALYPQMGATALLSGGSLTLQWSGADADDDISGYDIYFDVADPPVAVAGTSVSPESFQVNGLTASTVYYWRIVTNDSEGNTSASEVFQFRTAD